jgi:hypothetical protein
MERKEAVYKGLQFTPVYFEDTSLTSPDYFQITEFPTRLTAGKNLFKLRGHPTNLHVGGTLGIEVLDYNGDPIYTEVVDFIDDDKSRVISIFIYEDSSPGDCTITLVAEAEVINNQPVPQEWKGRTNIRWSRSVPVNPNVSNISEIIFETIPDVTVEEIIGVQLDRRYPNTTQFPTYNTGSVRYFYYNNQPAIEIAGGEFINDMTSGTITVSTPVSPTPTPNYTIPTTAYVSSIKKILSPTTALLDTEYTVYSSQSIYPHIYTEFLFSSYSISYEATPTYVETENSQSFAFIQISNLQPATGDVSRIKVFTNNNGTVGTWELVNDVELDEIELFITSTSSLYPDKSIGTFTSQSIINAYWDAHTYQNGIEITPTTLTWTTASLANAMLISSSIDITNKNSVQVAQIKSAYKGIFKANASYKVTIDALGTRNSVNNPKLSIYLSGSSFYQDPTDYFNQEFPSEFGKRIGEIIVTSDNQRFDDYVFNFEADYSGTGILLVVVEDGEWQIADVRTTTDNETGYTPDYTRLKTLINTTHKIGNQISFKVEYYNVNGEKSKQVSYVYNKDWEGGNRYIDGNYSMLTGSLYVADSLNSGVAISGYPNSGFVRSLGYEGFAAGFPGFLLWSGSALPGSAGTKGGAAYSGVGLELYANTSSYFRYSTTDSEIDVRTDKFFFGNPSSTFISGANGNIEISASNFHLDAQGNITASDGEFRGVNLADLYQFRAVIIDSSLNNLSTYIDAGSNPYYALNLTGSYDPATVGIGPAMFIRINVSLSYPIGAINIHTPTYADWQNYATFIVIESAGTNYISRNATPIFFPSPNALDSRISSDTDDWIFPAFQTYTIGTSSYSNTFKVNTGNRVFLAQSTNDWKIQTVSSYDTLSPQFPLGLVIRNEALYGAPNPFSSGHIKVSGSGADEHIYCYLNSAWKQLD